MATPIPPQVTPDDHLRELVALAEILERTAEWMNKPSGTRLGAMYARRAAAIRWLMAETAHGVDADELAG